jgi:hypothetical protein
MARPTGAPKHSRLVRPMKTLISTVLVLAVLLPTVAVAGSDCTTRRSGSVVITTCSDTRNPKAFNIHCRSYKSGSVTKTSCR